jgi:hypothetical protein
VTFATFRGPASIQGAGDQALQLAVDLLATHRLVRLATADTITQPIRDAVVCHAYRRQGDNGSTPANGWADYAEADPEAPKLASLVVCRWCTGIYVAALVVAARRLAPTPWGYLARALAASSAAALLAAMEDD